MRWVATGSSGAVREDLLPSGCRLAYDDADRPVVLFGESWALDLFRERCPGIALLRQPAEPARAVREAVARAAG